MHAGDFYHGEKSMTLDRARNVKMELITKAAETIVLKPRSPAGPRGHRLHVHEQEGPAGLLRKEIGTRARPA